MATKNINAEKIQGNLAITSVSATTYYNLPQDIYVTGGTYSGGTLTLNRQNGSISISGFTNGGSSVDTYVTGFTYSNNNLSILQNQSQSPLNINISTMTGLTINGNLSTTSISPIDYINFNVNPTIPSATGGTLYFDYNENALSYKPITNQNDVTVNIGQESLIRIYNQTGVQINNGQVLHITGATGGIPTVALANASKLGLTFTDSLAQSSGVATHNIPDGEYGFMANFGIVRDLDTSTFTVGQELFLSDTIDGGITDDPNSIAYTSRISTIGWCLTSDATTGKIYVKIENENPLQSLTQQEINVLLGNTISTGAYSYTGMTKASSTTVNVRPMRGWIVYNTYEYSTNPLVLNIYYSGGTNIPVTNINSSLDTYFLVNSGGTLYQQTSFPTPEERRNNIFLGRAVHPNKTSILNVEQNVDYDVSPLSSLRDLWTPIKLINQGVIPASNGANLQFKTSSGTFWGNGIGWDSNELNPNSITVPAYSPAHFYYTTQTGGSFTVTATTVDTLNYDVNGVITNIPGAGNYTTQRIYMSQSGVIRIQYGQNYYSTLAKAIAAIPSETFVENSDNGIDCILIGLLTVKDGASALNNTDDAIFTLVSKFGEVLGGTAGISTTTLQQAYNNSVNPEITTNTSLGGVQFKGGTGSDTDKNIIIENNASSETAWIKADGSSSFNSVLSNSVSATTANFSTINGSTLYLNGSINKVLYLDGSSSVAYSNTTSTQLDYLSNAQGIVGNGKLVFNNNTLLSGTTTAVNLSASTLNLYTLPTNNNSNTHILTRNTSTGNVEYINLSDYALAPYSAGIISGATSSAWSSTGTGQINLPTVRVVLFNNSSFIAPLGIYTVNSGTTNSGAIPSLSNNDTNYIVIDYNGGTPIWNVLTDDSTINDSSIILYMIVYRANNFIHTLDFGNQGAGLPNKLNDRIIMTDRFARESGFEIGLSGTTGVVTINSGVAWNGVNRQSLNAVSSSDTFFKNYHSGGTWTYTTTGHTINNSYYDNGTNIVSATTGYYLTNWYFRGQEINDHIYEVYSTNQYASVALAQLATIPNLPELITSHAFLFGRIIVGVGQTTGLTESAFVNTFQSTQVTSHNDLTAIQGGSAGQYYHINASQYNSLVYNNINNYFSTNQTINGSLSANTITLTTIPTTNNSNTEILSRNSSTGNIETTTVSSLMTTGKVLGLTQIMYTI